MGQVVADVYTVNLEKVRPDLPALYELAEKNLLYSKLTKGTEGYRISKTPNGNDFRIPLELQPPGTFGKMDLDGGALVGGTGTVNKQMYQTYFPVHMGVQLSMEAIKTTEDASLSVANAFKRNMKQALPNFKRYLDTSLHNIETGYQGLIALSSNFSAGAGTTGTFTFDNEFSANLLQVGQRVEVFSNNLSSHKTTGVAMASLPYVTSINRAAGTAAFTGLPTGGSAPANDDYLAFPGVTATPTWMNGLYYFHNSATSGLLLGLERSTYQELICPSVNAAGSLVPLHGTLLKARIRQRTGELPGKLIGVIHDAQAAQIVTLTIAISKFDRKKADEAIDPTPTYGESIPFCGVDNMIDIHASKKRIDWIDRDACGRVYLQEPDFYKDPQSTNLIHPVYNGDGSKLTAVQFWLWSAENFYWAKLNSGGMIYALTIPTDF